MKIKWFLVVLCFIYFIYCKERNDSIEISYRSLNDFDAHYVFNFKDTEANLKMINDYAIRRILLSKKYNDSLRQALMSSKKRTPSTLEEALNGNFPSTATDLVLYKAPKPYTLNPVDSTYILLIYKIDENIYKITDIEIPNIKTTSRILVKEKVTNPGITVLECNANVSLATLKQAIVKIKKLNYHKSVSSYTYQLVNTKERIAYFRYTREGKYLEITFP